MMVLEFIGLSELQANMHDALKGRRIIQYSHLSIKHIVYKYLIMQMSYVVLSTKHVVVSESDYAFQINVCCCNEIKHVA